MKAFLFSVTLILVLARASPLHDYDCSYCQPEQIHLSFGEKINDIVVTWTTSNDTQETRVQYGEADMNQEATGSRTIFTEGRGQYIHRVTLKDLKYDTKYAYHCGSKYAWSERFVFKTPPEGNDAMTQAIIYGDMGTTNAQSLPYIQEASNIDNINFVLHVGDFAYNLINDDARRGDKFMNQIQPIASVLPYMTVPGNHEEERGFIHYRSRFTMPMRKKYDSMYYSWEIGPVHFVGVNTEAWYFDGTFGQDSLPSQLSWLTQDLEEATKPENRKKHPWIILYGHRPMYCSLNDDIESCSYEATRVGIDGHGKYSLEPFLKKYGVDVVIWAHDHSYERMWPVYDGNVYNGSLEHPYVNPKAPVHIVSGAGGNSEYQDPFVDNPEDWSAFRAIDYGYTRFQAYNHTHIYFEQVSADKKGAVIDAFWVVKTLHAPYNF